MSAQTAILVAIGLALMIVGAVYGFGSVAMNLGDDTINNFSEEATDGRLEDSSLPNSENINPELFHETAEKPGVKI